MKISFDYQHILINGIVSGYMSVGGGCYVYLEGTDGRVCIGRFGKYSRNAQGEAKRWLKVALRKAGSALALIEALAPQEMTPIGYQKMPRARRTAKTRREESQRWAYALRLKGERVMVSHGLTYEHEKMTRATLIDVASEGYLLKMDDGTTAVLAHETVQMISSTKF